MTTDRAVPATASAKRTAALLRDARSVHRRLATLAATAIAIDDPSLPQIGTASEAVQQLVLELTYWEPDELRWSKAQAAGSVDRLLDAPHCRGPSWARNAAGEHTGGTRPTRSVRSASPVTR